MEASIATQSLQTQDVSSQKTIVKNVLDLGERLERLEKSEHPVQQFVALPPSHPESLIDQFKALPPVMMVMVVVNAVALAIVMHRVIF